MNIIRKVIGAVLLAVCVLGLCACASGGPDVVTAAKRSDGTVSREDALTEANSILSEDFGGWTQKEWTDSDEDARHLAGEYVMLAVGSHMVDDYADQIADARTDAEFEASFQEQVNAIVQSMDAYFDGPDSGSIQDFVDNVVKDSKSS